jgi:hypothetical protein
LLSRIDEHAVGAEIRWPYGYVLLEPFVDHGQLAELRIANILPNV